MSSKLTDDLKSQYARTFATIRGIAETFPEDRWLEPHGDEYYIPSRIAYHVAGFIDGFLVFLLGGGVKDPNASPEMPFGSWRDGTAETLPKKAEFIAYFDEVVGRANSKLEALDDDALLAALKPEFARMGGTLIGACMQGLRELSAHTGELNKMLVENGKDDVWR